MNNKVKFLLTLIYTCLFIVLTTLGYSKVNGIILFVCMISINLLLIIRSYRQKNGLLLVFFLFISIYTYALKHVFIDNKQLSYYRDFNDISLVFNTALIFFFFLISLNTFIKIPKGLNQDIFHYKKNDIFFYVFYIIATIAMVYGKIGENIFSSGGYNPGETQTSSLNEYFFIPYFLCIIFSNNEKSKISLIFLLGGIYAIKNLLLGGRIEVMMLVLCLFIWKFHYKFKPITIIATALVAFYFFNVIGNIRQNPGLLLSDTWYLVFIPESGVSDSNIIISQEGDVFYSTNRIISMVEKNIISTSERLFAFFYFILSIILPYSMLPDLANLPRYKIDEFGSGGGELIFTPFYVYMSYIGVILIAFYIAKILRSVSINNSFNFWNIYCVFVFITLPRWYAYSPITMFKLSLYGALICVVIVYLNKFFVKSFYNDLK